MKNIALKASVLFLCSVTILFLNLYYNQDAKTKNLVMPPTPSVRFFTFGYNETFGDSYWLTAIQNFSTCEQDRGGSSYAPSGARVGLDRTPSCSFGWLYHTLNLILDLIPRFYLVAANGPIVLSVIVDDIDGASQLYDKAVMLYPDDWVILSRAASHFAAETEDRQKAAQLFLRAARLGAPTWMALYASKLSSKEGQHVLSRKILEEFKNNPNLKDEDKKYIEEKLNMVKKKGKAEPPPFKGH